MTPEAIKRYARGWYDDFGCASFETVDSVTLAISQEAYGLTAEDMVGVAIEVIRLRDEESKK